MNESKVIVGISPSVAGLAALRYAVAESRRREVPLWAVRAYLFQSSGRTRALWLWDAELARESAELIAATFRLALGGMPDVPDLVVRTPNANTARALKDYVATPADLLVLGASDRLLSSVPRSCTRGAICPVIVVPPPEMAREGRRAARVLAREVAEALTESTSISG
jgi:nucleotide-binding universal stress UspA family protein